MAASPGRIRLEAFTFTRTAASDPPDTRDVPGLLFVPNLPGVRIATVAGQTVPLVPTGNADVTLPVTTVNPVTVTFATTNVPVGNTIKLTVVPASGATTTVTSSAISGSLAAGTATVQATLPGGSNVLLAQTTYTVIAAVGDALAPYAEGERVDKVRLSAVLGGASSATLITVSGKEFEVPAAVLAGAGGS